MLAAEIEKSGQSVRLEREIQKDFDDADLAWRAGAPPDPDLAVTMVRAQRSKRQYLRNVAHGAPEDRVIILDGGPISLLAHFPRDEARKLLNRAYDFPGAGVIPELLLNTYSAIAYVDSGAPDRTLYVGNDRATILEPGADVAEFVKKVASRAVSAAPVDPAKFRSHTALSIERGVDEGIRSAVVFTSAKTPTPIHGDALELLGRAIALRGWILVTGGDGVGSMRRVNLGCREAGGDTIRVSTSDIDAMESAPSGPDTIFIKSDADRDAARAQALQMRTVKIVSRQMYERNLLFENLTDAALWTPGGIGSLLEASIWMQFNQKAYQAKALGVLDIDGSHDSILKYLQELTDTGFAFPSDFDRFNVTVPLQYKYRGKYSAKVAAKSIERYLDSVVDVDKRLRAAAAGKELAS
jgi:predicted Rossmann-fold nucleotide-binding protein